MIKEIEKTCYNCKYDDEDMEGTHCRHCIHNATEHFEPKEVVLSEREIREKAIDEFAEKICQNGSIADFMKEYITEIAEQMKGRWHKWVD